MWPMFYGNCEWGVIFGNCIKNKSTRVVMDVATWNISKNVYGSLKDLFFPLKDSVFSSSNRYTSLLSTLNVIEYR